MSTVLYVGKHDQLLSSADDEGSIYDALQVYGHTVHRVREIMGRRAYRMKADFLLFHKWDDITGIEACDMPRVFWYFDLVEYPDSTIEARNQVRRNWMSKTLPLVHTGFCTDGDWVDKDYSGKLIHLTQGADHRIVGKFIPSFHSHKHDILFTGTKRGGIGRTSFVAEMENKWGKSFHHIQSGYYGLALNKLVSESSIVVAPDHPVTDKYWSNRIYVTLGSGGFLLHKSTKGLDNQYKNGCHYIAYDTRDILHQQIRYYLDSPNVRKEISEEGLRHTVSYHTYLNRVGDMIRTLKERGIG